MVFEYAQSINLIKNIPSEKVKLPKKKKMVEDIKMKPFVISSLKKKKYKNFY